MKQRNIAMAVIFSILTCGIYLFIWLWVLNNDLRTTNNKTLNSGTNLLLSFVTCGIYFIVWMYQLGKEIEEAGGKNNSVLFVILALVGFPIISIGIAQSEVNELCQRRR